MLMAVLIPLLSFAGVAASAVTFDCKVETYSDSILMVNLDTGMDVYSKNPDEKRYPANLTKIMTYVVAAEQFDDFENTRIEIKQSVCDTILGKGMTCSGMDWHVGEKLKVIDVLYELMMTQGHDAALVLADYIGQGDVSVFVQMMNDKAAQLGCQNTHSPILTVSTTQSIIPPRAICI